MRRKQKILSCGNAENPHKHWDFMRLLTKWNCVFEKLEILQKYQTEMKSMNNYYRKNGTCKDYKNLSDDEAIKIDTQIENGYSWEEQPFPDWKLSNNNANIRRIKERIEDLTRVNENKYESIEFKGGRIVVNKEVNRL